MINTKKLPLLLYTIPYFINVIFMVLHVKRIKNNKQLTKIIEREGNWTWIVTA